MHPGVENPVVIITSELSDMVARLGRSVSIDQAADLLGVSRRTIYYRIREGRLQTIRTMGGSQRVLVDSLQLIPRTRLQPLHPSARQFAGRVASENAQRTL